MAGTDSHAEGFSCNILTLEASQITDNCVVECAHEIQVPNERQFAPLLVDLETWSLRGNTATLILNRQVAAKKQQRRLE